MSKFEQFPQHGKKKFKKGKDRTISKSGTENAVDAVNAFLELTTLGLISPPNTHGKKKKK